MHLFASLLFAIVLMLKRSLFAETDVFSVGNRSLCGRRANEVILCWKPKPVRQESKRSYSLLMHSCAAGSTNNQTTRANFEFCFWE